jgi:hypothetical protein
MGLRLEHYEENISEDRVQRFPTGPAVSAVSNQPTRNTINGVVIFEATLAVRA